MEDYVAKKEWCPICYKIHVLTLFGGCESYEEAEGEHTIKELKKQNKILTDMLKLSIEDINLNAINFAEWILKNKYERCCDNGLTWWGEYNDEISFSTEELYKKFIMET
jgi:hypothetical protein